MTKAIIGGTGFDRLMQGKMSLKRIETPYGNVAYYDGTDDWEDIVFLPRHGPGHRVPPHKINYRANLKALQMLGTERILATFAVGSLSLDVEPGSLVVLDQFMDFTEGRAFTFYDGGASGLAHTEMTLPYCSSLRKRLLALAPKHELELMPRGTYVCTDGPRFETAAEVRMYEQLGGDVVGMTGVPEAPLARELGMHYAAVALSINWGAGLQEELEIVRGLEDKERALLALFVDVLNKGVLDQCTCESAVMIMHPPEEEV